MRRATQVKQSYRAEISISIHALLAESDFRLFFIVFDLFRFLSTLSLRRATTGRILRAKLRPISIHALLAESDFNAVQIVIVVVISIHALLAESDQAKAPKVSALSNFYPRSPCGERLRHCTTYLNCSRFLSTLSLRRATRRGVSCYLDNIISIHALLAESDPQGCFLLS